MSSWWRFYPVKDRRKQRSIGSIAKDEVTLLAERLQFFMPNFQNTYSLCKVMAYIFVYTLFTFGIKLSFVMTWHGFNEWQTINSWQALSSIYLLHLGIVILTVIPTLMLYDFQRDSLKKLSLIQACLRLIGTAILVGGFAALIGLFVAKMIGILPLDGSSVFAGVLIFEAYVIVVTMILIVYFWNSYKNLHAVKRAFEAKLIQQNEHINARHAPHFLFNTLNTLTSLIEADSDKATDMLQNVSHLMRTTFDEPIEISFEEEIETCEHYLAIEHYRLQDKLNVSWDLPDEDTIYDMSIASLTLQTVLEQTMLNVVEMTTDPVHVNIKVSWENHVVLIIVSAQASSGKVIEHQNADSLVNFRIQERYLREHFGPSAEITTNSGANWVVNTIRYRLHDALIA